MMTMPCPPEYEFMGDLPRSPADELADWLAELQENGRLVPIDDAPKDGTEFKAVLATNGSIVTVFYSRDHKYWLGEDRWQDANGDGAPDGHCPVFWHEDFAGQILPLAKDVGRG